MASVLWAMDVLDDPGVGGEALVRALREAGCPQCFSATVKGEAGQTDFVKAVIPGSRGKTNGGPAPTLGIIGRLGGVGARPGAIGLVSDADGAITALAAAMKLCRMAARGDITQGDVMIATHVCPDAPTIPHEPVAFMGAPVSMAEMNRYEVDPAMDAILSVDTTKGNRIVNSTGFAITPTVKEGYILRVSEDLLAVAMIVTGDYPVVLPITTQDITPYGNGVYHVNSIMQPSTVTGAPTVGVALTTKAAIPGCATGANNPGCLEQATRFVVEVAKAFTSGKCRFYEAEEYGRLLGMYGSLERFQTIPWGFLADARGVMVKSGG